MKGNQLPSWALLRNSNNKMKEYHAFHHGSYLLYTQRGLLETLPLDYSCSSVAPGATVKSSLATNGNSKAGDPARAESLLAAYLNVHKPTKNLGYMFSYRQNDPVQIPSNESLSSSALQTTPTSLPMTVTSMSEGSKEMFLCIEGLKPGSLYSAVINFESPVYLTDMAFQLSAYMFSVSVDVWLDKGSENIQARRVAQSSELNSRSFILGNIMPPVLCQYARINYVGRMNASSEKCAVSLGCFYGLPYFPPELSPACVEEDLSSEVSTVFNQYSKSREELMDTLSMYSYSQYSQVLKHQMEKQISTLHTGCFNIQTRLARLRNVLSYKRSTSQPLHPFSLQEKREEAENTICFLPLKKLLKLTTCLIDSMLITMDSLASPTLLEPLSLIMEESGFRVLFLTHCVNSCRNLHARVCAILVRLCGNRPWWGRVIADLFKELFSSDHTNMFNKER